MLQTADWSSTCFSGPLNRIAQVAFDDRLILGEDHVEVDLHLESKGFHLGKFRLQMRPVGLAITGSSLFRLQNL
jgi:hypothetical protein